jgi:hypothetical protein
VEPLPDLASLQTADGTPNRRASSRKYLNPDLYDYPVMYDGTWQAADGDEIVCRIQRGQAELFTSADSPVQLHVGPSGEAMMEINGTIHIGTFEDGFTDKLFWENGQVWYKVPEGSLPQSLGSAQTLDPVLQGHGGGVPGSRAEPAVTIPAAATMLSQPRCPPNPALQEMLDWSEVAQPDSS